MDKVNPFIYYLTSKYKNIVEWDQEYEITFNVGIGFSEEDYFHVLNDYKIHMLYHDTTINFTNQELENYTSEDVEKLAQGPFCILITVHAEYINRSNDEEEPVKITKLFKTDQCVICLNNQPNILFYDCMHICTCLECEELKPLNSCPNCRAIAIEKNCI